MLAGTEEAFHAGKSCEVTKPTRAIDALLAGLIDYAGLYPPANLDMRSAVHNYLQYRESPHASVLGRFVVNLDRFDELRTIAGESLADMPLSVILPPGVDLNALPDVFNDDLGRVTFECKVTVPADIESISAQLPDHAECYFEIPMEPAPEEFLDRIAFRGARVKLRTGGMVEEAIPSTQTVALMLQALAGRHLPFKATAGLHHAVRSRYPLTYATDSNTGLMHGFLNLAFAAMQTNFHGAAAEILRTLEEQDADAWQVTPETIRCRGLLWSTDQVRAVREHFFLSFGSCSFEEPIRDLETMGWL